jgi:hypothetical protein
MLRQLYDARPSELSSIRKVSDDLPRSVLSFDWRLLQPVRPLPRARCPYVEPTGRGPLLLVSRELPGTSDDDCDQPNAGRRNGVPWY